MEIVDISLRITMCVARLYMYTRKIATQQERRGERERNTHRCSASTGQIAMNTHIYFTYYSLFKLVPIRHNAAYSRISMDKSVVFTAAAAVVALFFIFAFLLGRFYFFLSLV